MKIVEIIQNKLREFFFDARKLDLDTILHNLAKDIRVSRIRNTNLYVIVRLYYPSFISASDIASILYCERKVWFMYNYLSHYRYSINIVDIDGLERVTRGLYVHKLLAQSLSNLNLSSVKPEFKLIDFKIGLVGIIDVLIEKEKDVADIVEVKVTWRNKLYDNWVLQTALYSHLLQNVLKRNVDKMFIITCSAYWKLKFTEKLCQLASDIIEYARWLLRQSSPPEITRDINKCKRCGFKFICLGY